MIEFCYKKIEEYLKQIENSVSVKVFEQSRRLVREKPDWDFIKANVSVGNPYCCIVISAYKETPMGFLFDTYTDYSKTDITHTGSGTATYELTGNHKGNNSYVLKITTGGTVGTEPYPQYALSFDGGETFGDPQDIPADGKISIGDGMAFEFEVGGAVVIDDTYAWQTIAKRVSVFKEKGITIKIRTEIWAKKKKELFESEEGYLDQFSNLLIERYVTDGVQVIRQLPGTGRWIQTEFEEENEIVRAALEVTYEGAHYSTKEDALVGELIIQGG